MSMTFRSNYEIKMPGYLSGKKKTFSGLKYLLGVLHMLHSSRYDFRRCPLWSFSFVVFLVSQRNWKCIGKPLPIRPSHGLVSILIFPLFLNETRGYFFQPKSSIKCYCRRFNTSDSTQLMHRTQSLIYD